MLCLAFSDNEWYSDQYKKNCDTDMLNLLFYYLFYLFLILKYFITHYSKGQFVTANLFML